MDPNAAPPLVKQVPRKGPSPSHKRTNVVVKVAVLLTMKLNKRNAVQPPAQWIALASGASGENAVILVLMVRRWLPTSSLRKPFMEDRSAPMMLVTPRSRSAILTSLAL